MPTNTTVLSESFLQRILDDYSSSEIIGITLLGSHARGEAGPLSDVDIDLFVEKVSSRREENYVLRYIDNTLVSLKRTTVAEIRETLRRPERAVWAAPGISHMRILSDREGILEELRREAAELRWEPLRKEAEAYASYQLTHAAEECHKLIGALQNGDESTIAYALIGLLLTLTEAVAVHHGVMIVSENRLFTQTQEVMGTDSEWTRNHRIVAGYTSHEHGVSALKDRAIAGLRLYRESAALIQGALAPDQRTVVEQTMALIDRATR